MRWPSLIPPARLRANATFQRRVLAVLLAEPGHSLRSLTAALFAHRLTPEAIRDRQRWYQARRDAGEGSASMRDQALHYRRAVDRLLRSRAAPVLRALKRLRRRGLVEREDDDVVCTSEAWPWTGRCSCYTLTPAGAAVAEALTTSELLPV